MKNCLWIIETTDSEGKIIRIVTNDFTLDAQEICDIYCNCWLIKIFFKWIKQHLFIKHFYGTGKQAAELQSYIALTTYCLLTLLKQKIGYKGSLLNLKNLFVSAYMIFFPFMRKLDEKSKRQSRGR